VKIASIAPRIALAALTAAACSSGASGPHFTEIDPTLPSSDGTQYPPADSTLVPPPPPLPACPDDCFDAWVHADTSPPSFDASFEPDVTFGDAPSDALDVDAPDARDAAADRD
jgi:hypothetical protein